jgi:hypothetical protein
MADTQRVSATLLAPTVFMFAACARATHSTGRSRQKIDPGPAETIARTSKGPERKPEKNGRSIYHRSSALHQGQDAGRTMHRFPASAPDNLKTRILTAGRAGEEIVQMTREEKE